jgi:eukaryotic-like serine/threonine-protein kinase
MEPPPLRIVDDDRYREFTPIGQGGMGVVYLALDTELNRQVALKIVRPDRVDGSADPAAGPLELSPPPEGTPGSGSYRTLTDRFLQEAMVTGGLEHPGIVPVYELGRTAAGIPYYTMRFVKGERTLETAIREAASIDDRLSLLEVFLRICDTMSYAHSRGVIHRDLKPANIALGEFGEVVVIDWGLARVADRPDIAADRWQSRIHELREASDLKTVDSILGTPGYLAPEATAGDPGQVDHRADVYSLGVLLFEILTGRLPHEFKTFTELLTKLVGEEPPAAHVVDDRVPEEISRICARALRRKADERTKGARELAREIRDWQRESAVKKEARAVLAQADAIYEGAAELRGELLLPVLDRVSSLVSRALLLVPDLHRAKHLKRMCGKLREEAIRGRERAARGSLLRRVVFIGLLLLPVIALGVSWFLTVQKGIRNKIRARDLADASRRVESEDPTLALLLSVAAAEADPHPEVIRQLRRSLQHAGERAILEDPAGAGYHLIRLSPGGNLILAVSRTTVAIYDRDGRSIFSEPLARLDAPLAAEPALTSASFSPRGDRFMLSTGNRDQRAASAIFDLEGRLLLRLEHLVTDRGPRARFSPDGKSILSADPKGNAVLLDLDGKSLASFAGDRPAPVRHLSFLPGRAGVLVAFEGDPGLHRFTLDGTARPSLSGGTDTLSHPVVALKGHRILVRAGEQRRLLFDQNGEQIAVLEHGGDPGPRPAFDRLGENFLTATGETVTVHGSDGRPIRELKGHAGRVLGFEWSRDGKSILTRATDRKVRLYTSQGKLLALFSDHRKAVEGAGFTPNGRIMTFSIDGTIRFYGRDGQEEQVIPVPGGEVRDVAFLAPANRLLCGTSGGALRLIDLFPGEGPILGPGVTAASFAADGERLAVGFADGSVVTHDSGRDRWDKCKAHHGEVTGVVGTSSGWVTTGDDGRIRTWSASLRPLAEILQHAGPVAGAALSKNGRFLLTVLADGTARLVGLESDEIVELTGHEGPIRGARFSPEGVQAVTWSDDGTVRWFDLAGQPIGTFLVEAPVLAVRFTSRPGRLVTLDLAGKAKLWDQKAGLLKVYGEAADRFTAIATSHRSEVTALGLANGSLATGERIHEDAIRTLALSPKGRLLATGSDDFTARVLDRRRRELALLEGHLGPVTEISFSLTGDKVLTLATDGTARVWFLKTEDLLRAARARLCRDFTDEERERYTPLLAE